MTVAMVVGVCCRVTAARRREWQHAQIEEIINLQTVVLDVYFVDLCWG